MTRTLASLSTLFLFTACGGSTPPPKAGDSTTSTSTSPLPDVASVRTDLHCTQKSNGEEAACKAKADGCLLGPPLECYGTPPPPEYREESRKRYEASADTCTCVCPIDQKRCAEVP